MCSATCSPPPLLQLTLSSQSSQSPYQGSRRQPSSSPCPSCPSSPERTERPHQIHRELSYPTHTLCHPSHPPTSPQPPAAQPNACGRTHFQTQILRPLSPRAPRHSRRIAYVPTPPFIITHNTTHANALVFFLLFGATLAYMYVRRRRESQKRAEHRERAVQFQEMHRAGTRPYYAGGSAVSLDYPGTVPGDEKKGPRYPIKAYVV